MAQKTITKLSKYYMYQVTLQHKPSRAVRDSSRCGAVLNGPNVLVVCYSLVITHQMSHQG